MKFLYLLLFLLPQLLLPMEDNSIRINKKKFSYEELFSKLIKKISKMDVPGVKKLIKSKTPINKQNKWGMTPLMHVIITLQKYRSRITEKNHREKIFKKAKKIFKILMNHSPNLNIQDQQGRTALMYAAMFGLDYFVKELSNAQAKLNLVDDEGLTAYKHSKSRKERTILKYAYYYVYQTNLFFYDTDFENNRKKCMELLKPKILFNLKDFFTNVTPLHRQIQK